VSPAFRRFYQDVTSSYTGLLCLLAGLLLPFAFAPVGIGLLAVPILAWLFFSWSDASPRQAFRYGFLFGLGQFTAGVYWIYHSLYEFGHIPTPVAMLLVVVLAAGLALYPALAGYLANRISLSASSMRLLAIYPASWLLMEWLRGFVLTGFPWLNLGASQTDTQLAGWMPVVGEYGVTLLLGISAGALVCLFRFRSGYRWPVAVALLSALWISGWALQQQSWSETSGSLSVSLVQGNTPQEIKWDPDARTKILNSYLILSKEVWKRDLIIWPETAIPAFAQDIENFLQGLSGLTKLTGSDLITGIPMVEKGRYYNAIITLGSESGRYYKRHLVPFGEYIPLRSVFGSLLDLLHVPMSDFSTGRMDQPPLKVAGQLAGLSICYEIAFSSVIRAQLPEAGFLVNLSNNAWFGDSIAPHQILQLSRVRAMETSRAVLSSTNDGITAVVDHRGQIQAQAQQFIGTVLNAEVQIQTGETPFVRWGERPVVIFAILLLVAGFVRSCYLENQSEEKTRD